MAVPNTDDMYLIYLDMLLVAGYCQGTTRLTRAGNRRGVPGEMALDSPRERKPIKVGCPPNAPARQPENPQNSRRPYGTAG